MNSIIESSNFECIQSPLQEVQFWKDLRDQSKVTSIKDVADEIYSTLTSIIPVFESLGNVQVSDHEQTKCDGMEAFHEDDIQHATQLRQSPNQILTILEQNFTDGNCIESTLYDIFLVKDKKGNYVYTASRMENFIKLISSCLCTTLQRTFTGTNRLFALDPRTMKTTIMRCKDILVSYQQMLYRLTKIDFSIRDKDPWEQESGFQDKNVSKLVYRIDTVFSVRATYHETVSILSPQDCKCLNLVEIFINTDALDVFNDASELAFETAVQTFNNRLKPMEYLLAKNLQDKVQNLDAPPFTILSTFEKFPYLLQRRGITKNLNAVMTRLSELLKGMLESIDKAIDSAISENDPVYGIFKIRQYRKKTQRIQTGFRTAVSTNVDIAAKCSELVNKCNNYERKLFSHWIITTGDILLQKLKSLEQKHSLIEINGSNILRVTFDDDLARIIDQERKLKLLNFDTGRIQEQVAVAKKYYKLATLLNKAVSIRNKIELSASCGERDLLHASIKEFDDLIQRSSVDNSHRESIDDLPWSNIEKSEEVAFSLNTVAIKLSATAKSTNFHYQNNSQRVYELLKGDLLVHKSEWLKIYQSIENGLLDQTSNKGGKWILYWSHQLFKVFDVTYIKGLMRLDKLVRDIRCEVVINGNQIDTHPSLSEIRSVLYAQLRSFAEYPIKHNSFLSSTVMFHIIPRINEESAAVAVRLCERIIVSLKAKIRRYTKLLIPLFDISSYAKACCREANDFSKSFQQLRLQKRMIEKLPEVENVSGCITVSLRRFKHLIVDRILYLEDSLMNSLQQNAKDDYNLVNDFISTTSSLLTEIPTVIDDIAHVESNWKVAKSRWMNIENIATAATDKFQLLLKLSVKNVQSFHNKRDEMRLEQNEKWIRLTRLLHIFSKELCDKKSIARSMIVNDLSSFDDEVQNLQSRWKAKQSMAVIPLSDANWYEIELLSNECENLIQRQHRIERNCVFLEVEFEMSSELQYLCGEIHHHKELKALLVEFNDQESELYDKKWKKFDIKFLHDFLTRWQLRLEGLVETKFVQHVSSNLSYLEKCIPVLTHCRGDIYKDEHWAELYYNIFCLPRMIPIKDVTIKDLIQGTADILSSSTLASIQQLQKRAIEEVALQESLDEVIVWFKSFTLISVKHHFRDKYTPLISQLKENSCLISDQLDILASLKESVHYQTISDMCLIYESKLTKVHDIIEKLNEVQRKWLHLEPIYSSGTITVQQNLFHSADHTFRSIMARNENPSLKQLADEGINSDMCRILENVTVDLEQCQLCLYQFLEEKRFQFPRLFFLGDEALLDILAHSKQPQVVLMYIKHITAAIHSVDLDSKLSKITAFKSAHDEKVVLRQFIDLNDCTAEVWMKHLCDEQKNTLSRELIDSFNSFSELDPIQSKIPCQIFCLRHRINFARRIENVFVNGQHVLSEVKETLNRQVSELSTTTATTKNQVHQRKEYELIIQIIHQRDVVDTLILNRCCESSDWAWQSQLRYYMKNNRCEVIIGETIVEYSFEYQGNEESLVRTPLTDKCYLNLTQAMRFGYGGNLFGPAGTGKTETVKALGSSLGRQVLVFNCNDELNYKSVGRMFMGLVMSGSWGCFDEFNRLKEDQLSAIADQIQTILSALKKNDIDLVILQKRIPINNHAAIFVTMNPAGGDYGGRSNLPSNLKMLFRPVAMGFPDKYKIAEVALLSCGFHNSSLLGSKLIHVFSVAQKILTYKNHYDWGLRCIKAIIRGAGQNRRLVITNNIVAPEEILQLEKDILMSSVIDSVIGKLNKADSQSFQSLLSHTFQSHNIQGAMIQDRILDVIQNECNVDMHEKLFQLKKALHERIGCIIVGPVNSGKSSLWKELKNALNMCDQPVVTFAVNPKALPRNHIFGKLDTDTGEWVDGVITAIVRQAILNEGRDHNTWIICDGDIDPEWIESLNSVLDDNRLLTLPTGERLHLCQHINFIFETRDLSFASPATITRNAIICTNQRDSFHPNVIDIDMKTILSWANKHDHFILMGKEGSGRDYTIYESFSRQHETEFLNIHCHENTIPQDIIDLLKESCTLSLTPHGAMYRPTHSKKIALVLKNIQCVYFDRYGTSPLLAFFHHWFDYGGFYDKDAKFYLMKDIQVIFVGTEALGTRNCNTFQRLAKNMNIGVKLMPSKQNMSTLLSQLWSNESENKHFADLTFQIIAEASDQSVPFYILVKWVENVTKYKEGICCIAYEGRRTIENLCFDRLESQDMFLVVQKICNQLNIDFLSSFYFFNPLSPSTFSLIEQREASGIISKFLDCSSQGVRIHISQEVIQTLSDIQHGLHTGSKNVLLLGKYGTGRKTLIKLACQLNNINYFTLTTTSNWSSSKFRSQMQHFLVKAGIENEMFCLHIEEHILTETEMTSMICQILSGGESCLSTFFDAKILKDCLSHLNNNYDTRMKRDLKRSKYIFLSNIKANLRISMSMELSPKKAAELCKMHPSLKRYTEIVLMKEWEDSSLRTYIQKRCKTLFDSIGAHQEAIIDAIHHMHKSTKSYIDISQLDFMDFIDVWSTLFFDQNEKMESEIDTLELGLARLNESNEKINELKHESELVATNVRSSQSAADEAMTNITNEMTNAQMKMKETEELKATMATKSNECNVRKDSIENEIVAIQPVLEMSKQAVKGIKREHLNEIKSFKTPPQPICDVLSGVLLLLGINDLSWNSMKAFLSKRGIVDEIINFDVKTVAVEIVNKVKRLVSKNEKSFDKLVISRVSVAAAPLAVWVKANIEYNNVLTSVKPLESELNIMKKELDECQRMLASYETSLTEINTRVDELKSVFSFKTMETERLKLQLEAAQNRSKSAVSLITQLEVERERWHLRAIDLKYRKSTLWLELLLHSAYVTYLSDKNEETRADCKKLWLDHLHNVNKGLDFNLLHLYRDVLGSWMQWGLQNDNFCLENAAIIATRSPNRITYVIDPNDLAMSWLKSFVSRAKKKSLDIVQGSDPKLCTKVELSVKRGRSLIIKDLFHLEPFLFPLLKKDVFYEDSRSFIQIGSKRISYDNNFEVFLISKTMCNGVPHGMFRIVDFTITKGGLKNRLLSTILDCVRPTLGDELRDLAEAKEKISSDLTIKESKVLEMLCNNDGDLLQNKELIETLVITKQNATILSKTLADINEAKKEIDIYNKQWFPIADASSSLYFTILELNAIDHFYDYTIESFEMVFRHALSVSQERRKNFIDHSLLWEHILQTILLILAPSICSKDQVASFQHIFHGLEPLVWKEKAWNAFLQTSFADVVESDVSQYPSWAQFHGHKKMFGYLKQHYPDLMNRNFDCQEWEHWLTSRDPYSYFPVNVTNEDRLLLIKTFFPDRFHSSVAKYCCDKLGIQSMNLNSKTLSQHWNEYLKEFQLPIMLIMEQENDPGAEILSLAESINLRLTMISLGGVSYDSVLEIVKLGASEGQWVCLKNLHLAADYLPALERELDHILVGDCHNHFRLWFTTEKRETIPVALISRSFKVYHDPPSGLKENIKQTYTQWEEDTSIQNGYNNNDILKSKLCFILAWTHAILKERGSFHGWRETYDFTPGDLMAARSIIEIFHNQSNVIDITKDFLTKFVYGGKISNTNDERVLKAYVDLFFSEEVVNGYRDLFPGFRFQEHWDEQTQHRSIRDIPSVDSPLLFGLPSNISRSLQRNLGVSMIQKLQQLEKKSLREKSQRPVWYGEAESIINHWKNISYFKKSSRANRLTKDSPDDPFHRFIQNEISLGDNLFQTVSSSINLLERAMSKNTDSEAILLQQMQDCLINNYVPRKWKELWNGPTDIKTWMTEMINKKKSIDLYQAPNDIFRDRVSLNLNDFFNTASLLCSLREKLAKDFDFAMDDVFLFAQFESSQDDTYKMEGHAFVSISGLFLTGCVVVEKFDGSFTAEQVEANMPDYQLSPPIRLSFQHQSSVQTTDTQFLIPVYSNMLSEDILFHVSLSCEESSVQNWILAGVALYLQC